RLTGAFTAGRRCQRARPCHLSQRATSPSELPPGAGRVIARRWAVYHPPDSIRGGGGQCAPAHPACTIRSAPCFPLLGSPAELRERSSHQSGTTESGGLSDGHSSCPVRCPRRRLLPWSGPTGKPCYLASDGGLLSQFA